LNTKKLTLISLLVLGSLILSACTGQAVSNNWHGVAADSERAYVANGSYVYAVDLKNGNEIWRYPEKADSKLSFFATPVLTADGQLLIGSAGTKNYSFFSLDPSTGKEKWSEPFNDNEGAWLASPLVFNDKIYAPNTDGFVYILDMNGKQIADPIELGGALWAAPVTDGKLLYIAALDHSCILLIQLIIALLLTPLILAARFPAVPLLAAMVSMRALSLPQLSLFNPMEIMKSLPLLKIGFGVLPFLMVKHFIMLIWMEKSTHLTLLAETRIGLCSQPDQSWRVCSWPVIRSTLQVNRIPRLE